MPFKTLIAAALVLWFAYYLFVRPFRRLSELRTRAATDNGVAIALKESMATAPMPMVKYRNRLFPRLYLYEDRIEYHILTNKTLHFADMDAIELGNRSMFNYLLTVVSGGDSPTTTVFTMKADQAEQCWALLQSRCDIQDKRIPW